VEDLQARLEKLLTDAEDCALIGKLAPRKEARPLQSIGHRPARHGIRCSSMIALKRAEPDGDNKKPQPG
jgi:hypothetical protein